MAKPSLGARQGAILRYLAEHPGITTYDLMIGTGHSPWNDAHHHRLARLWLLDLAVDPAGKDGLSHWDLTDAGREWLATRANPMVVPPKPKRLVIGRRMRACVAYVAKHEGCTKYAAGKAVTRPGHQRDGWVIVQRCIDAGLISARKRRDGTTALSVTEAGWVS